MSTSISLSDLNSLTPTEIDNKNKLKVTGIDQVPSDKPRSFYDNSGSAQTINVGPAPNDISSAEIQDHIKKLYADAFGRDPVFNDDMSDTADYWIGAVQRGDQGDLNWEDWLEDSIYGSQERSRLPVITQHEKDLYSSKNSGGGGGYSGPTMNDIKAMMEEMFNSYSTPWAPVGYGWGGTNANAVRINKSQKSRFGTPYAGNKSSFNRSGSRLNSQGTPWMNTLGE